MKKLIPFILSIWSVLLIANLKAAEPDVKLLLGGLAEMFSKVSSLEYKSTRNIQIHSGDIDQSVYQTGLLSWRSSGDKFYYNIVPLNRSGNVRTVAYDGIHSQILEEKEGVLYLDSSKFRALPGQMANDLFLPFLFFPQSEKSVPPFSDSPLATVFNSVAWESLVNEVSEIGVSSVATAETVILEFPGPPVNGVDDHTVFRVHFSISPTTRGFPIQWELLNNNRAPLIRYSVGQIGEASISSGGTFLYPKTATKESFGLGTIESPLMNKPISTVTYNITELIINSQIDQELFNIDISLARTIYDVNTKQFLKVPR